MHWEDDVDYRDEGGPSVGDHFLSSYPSLIAGVIYWAYHSFTSFRGLIVNFEFDVAYERQQAKPAAAITMSMFEHFFALIRHWIWMTWLFTEPTDGMPLRVRPIRNRA